MGSPLLSLKRATNKWRCAFWGVLISSTDGKDKETPLTLESQTQRKNRLFADAFCLWSHGVDVGGQMPE